LPAGRGRLRRPRHPSRLRRPRRHGAADRCGRPGPAGHRRVHPAPGADPGPGRGAADRDGPPQHKVDWLIGAAVDGYLELEETDGAVTLVRLPAMPARPSTCWTWPSPAATGPPWAATTRASPPPGRRAAESWPAGGRPASCGTRPAPAGGSW